jgi:hypothetical protein
MIAMPRQAIYIMADTISPYLFVTVFRLVVANLIIALIETFIISKFWLTSRRSLFGWMVAANYFSAIVGPLILLLISGVIYVLFCPIVYHFRAYLVCVFVVALMISFALEFPFVAMSSQNRFVSIRRKLVACFLAQIGSYVLLLPLYWLTVFSDLRHFSQPVPNRTLDFVMDKSASLVFLSGPYLQKVRLDGSPVQTILEVQPPVLMNLSVRKNEIAGNWDLWLSNQWNSEQHFYDDDRVLLKDIAAQFPCCSGDGDVNNVVDWRDAADRTWKILAYSEEFAPKLGMTVSDSIGGESYKIRLFTLFLSWSERCPNILPGNQVVFEINNEIVVMDLKTLKMYFLAYGHSPLVISRGN